ncbi:MAG: hypothetical protein QM541_17115 [Flavobacterium sp.]|nr:hypothetical protein [Flavobacterium sp.]
MIDLKLLEAEIDIVLENETTDTLLNWLYQKRISDMKKRFNAFVGVAFTNKTLLKML